MEFFWHMTLCFYGWALLSSLDGIKWLFLFVVLLSWAWRKLCLELFAPLGWCARGMGIFHRLTWSRCTTVGAEAVLVSLVICYCFKIWGTSGGVILGPYARAAVDVGSSRGRGRMWLWSRSVCALWGGEDGTRHLEWLCFGLEQKYSWVGKTQLWSPAKSQASAPRPRWRLVSLTFFILPTELMAAWCWLLPGCCLPGAHMEGQLCPSPGATQICFLEGCRRIDVLGASPVYLLCQHLQHVSILPEKHRLFLAFDSVLCSLPGLIIVSLFPFPPVFAQSDSALFF